MAVDIAQLLAFAVKNNASDLHLSAGVPPMIRVDGDVKRVNMPPLTHKEVHSMVYDIMNDKQRKVLRGVLRDRLFVRDPEPRALPRQRLQPEPRRRRRVPQHPVADQVARRPERAEGVQGPVHAAARPRAGDRPDRLRQVHDARRHGRLRQRQPPRAHHHDRGPDRVRARVEALPGQPARGAPRHARLQRGAALGAARGPGRHPGRRNARPRDDPARADRGRDRPPRVRHAAHAAPRRRPSTASSTCSRRPRRRWCARCSPSRCARSSRRRC